MLALSYQRSAVSPLKGTVFGSERCVYSAPEYRATGSWAPNRGRVDAGALLLTLHTPAKSASMAERSAFSAWSRARGLLPVWAALLRSAWQPHLPQGVFGRVQEVGLAQGEEVTRPVRVIADPLQVVRDDRSDFHLVSESSTVKPGVRARTLSKPPGAKVTGSAPSLTSRFPYLCLRCGGRPFP